MNHITHNTQMRKKLQGNSIFRVSFVVVFFVVWMLVATSLAHAALLPPAHPLIPPSLGPGDSFQIIFVSSTTRDATATTIGPYDAFVNADADSFGFGPSSPLPITWTAVANVVDGTLATSHAAQSHDVYVFSDVLEFILFRSLVHGLYSPFFSPDPIAHIPELGGGDPPSEAYTGLDLFAPSSLSFALGASSVISGVPGGPADPFWATVFTVSPLPDLPLYGLSEPLTVLPEPSTFAFGLMGLLSLSCHGRRRRKR